MGLASKEMMRLIQLMRSFPAIDLRHRFCAIANSQLDWEAREGGSRTKAVVFAVGRQVVAAVELARKELYAQNPKDQDHDQHQKAHEGHLLKREHNRPALQQRFDRVIC